jgi:hypothetical protein
MRKQRHGGEIMRVAASAAAKASAYQRRSGGWQIAPGKHGAWREQWRGGGSVAPQRRSAAGASAAKHQRIGNRSGEAAGVMASASAAISISVTGGNAMHSGGMWLWQLAHVAAGLSEALASAGVIIIMASISMAINGENNGARRNGVISNKSIK